MVPASGPKRSAALMVKLSEIEKATGMLGRRSVAQPLRIVRPIRMKHGHAIGATMSAPIDQSTAATPATITVVRYTVVQGHCAIVRGVEAIPTERSALRTPLVRSESVMVHRSA